MLPYLARRVFRIRVSRGQDGLMFVRKKPSTSGSVSVQVVDKSIGYRVVETMGSACDPEEPARWLWANSSSVGRTSSAPSELTHTMYEMAFALPDDRGVRRVPLRMDAEHQQLY